jgi:hypothetical protein
MVMCGSRPERITAVIGLSADLPRALLCLASTITTPRLQHSSAVMMSSIDLFSAPR